MERTRFFRRPMVWIILVILGALALSSLFTRGASYTRVTTSEALQQLKDQNVHKVLIEDKEQTFDLDLKRTISVNGASTDKIQMQVPATVIDVVYGQVMNA